MAIFDRIFGFSLKKKPTPEAIRKKSSFVFPSNNDGATLVSSIGGQGSYSAYLDLDGTLRDEYQLITRYRDMTLQPEVDQSVNHVVNDAIVQEPGKDAISINLDKLEKPNALKEKIREEFKTICRLLDFNNQAYDIFRRWYIDGRIFYHLKIDEEDKTKGIQELIYIDPRQIKKVREIEVTPTEAGVSMVSVMDEYFIYTQEGSFQSNINSDQGVSGYGSGGGGSNFSSQYNYTFTRTAQQNQFQLGTGMLKLSTDSVILAHSNLVDPSCKFIVSHLHQAIRFTNLLRMLEDAIIIYRISRAPERRVFYIDTEGLPPGKANEHVREVMESYRNQTTYDAVTGEVRDDKRHLSMLDDFWLPRRTGTSGSEVQNLSGGQNLGELADLEYFQTKLYEALKVPVSRFKRPDKGIVFGNEGEVTQDENHFARFVTRLRMRFSTLFDELLEKQLRLKGILTEKEWSEVKEDIHYDFNSDSYFSELKDTKLLQSKIATLSSVEGFEGKYFSRKYIQMNVLGQTEDEILDIEKQIKEEKQKLEDEKKEQAELQADVDKIESGEATANDDSIDSINTADDHVIPIEEEFCRLCLTEEEEK